MSAADLGSSVKETASGSLPSFDTPGTPPPRQAAAPACEWTLWSLGRSAAAFHSLHRPAWSRTAFRYPDPGRTIAGPAVRPGAVQ